MVFKSLMMSLAYDLGYYNFIVYLFICILYSKVVATGVGYNHYVAHLIP